MQHTPFIRQAPAAVPAASLIARSSNTHPKHPRNAGMTLLELIIACAVLMVLASAAMPVARYTVKRQKEAELRRDLREMRDAIDRYKDAADRNKIQVQAGTDGYPPDLDTLVKGVDLVSTAGGTGGLGAGIPGAGIPNALTPGPSGFTSAPQAGGGFGGGFGSSSGIATANSLGNTNVVQHIRFLRRIPVDPMTGRADWGMRSVQDDPDSKSWGGTDVFDVFSLSIDTALDGTKYSDW